MPAIRKVPAKLSVGRQSSLGKSKGEGGGGRDRDRDRGGARKLKINSHDEPKKFIVTNQKLNFA